MQIAKIFFLLFHHDSVLKKRSGKFWLVAIF